MVNKHEVKIKTWLSKVVVKTSKSWLKVFVNIVNRLFK